VNPTFLISGDGKGGVSAEVILPPGTPHEREGKKGERRSFQGRKGRKKGKGQSISRKRAVSGVLRESVKREWGESTFFSHQKDEKKDLVEILQERKGDRLRLCQSGKRKKEEGSL